MLGKTLALGHDVPVCQDNLAEKDWIRLLHIGWSSTSGTKLTAKKMFKEHERRNDQWRKIIFELTKIELLPQIGLIYSKCRPDHVISLLETCTGSPFPSEQNLSPTPLPPTCPLVPFPLHLILHLHHPPPPPSPLHSPCSNNSGLWAMPGVS